jgi:hypothetical protein
MRDLVTIKAQEEKQVFVSLKKGRIKPDQAVKALIDLGNDPIAAQKAVQGEH